MSIRETKKTSSRRLLALVISIGIHAALIYFIGRAALDYVLPEGEVTSSEMTFETPLSDNTDVDVVETTPTPAPPPASEPVAPVPPKPKPEAPPEDIPVPVSEIPPEVEDVHGEEPEVVPTPVPPQPIEEPTPPTPEPAPPTPEPSAPAPTAATAAPGAASSAPAFSGPVQSDSVLIPFGTNKPLTYPMMGRLKKLEGVSVIHYTVNETGSVTNIQIAQSSGHAVLDNQAVDTVKTWKFKPTGRVGIYERPIRWAIKGEAETAPSQLRRGQ